MTSLVSVDDFLSDVATVDKPRQKIVETDDESPLTSPTVYDGHGQTIIRVSHDKGCPYVVVAKKTINDRSLSFAALGFLVFLLSKPDNWRVRPRELAKETGISKATVYRLLDELKDAGYVLREVFRRNEKGQFTSGSVYTVYEIRHTPALKLHGGQKREGYLNGERIPF